MEKIELRVYLDLDKKLTKFVWLKVKRTEVEIGDWYNMKLTDIIRTGILILN